MNEGNAVSLAERAARLVVGHDDGDLHRKLAVLHAIEQVEQTVVVLRHHHEEMFVGSLVAQAESCSETVDGGLEDRPNPFGVLDWRGERCAHAELRGQWVAVLLVVDDVPLRLEERCREGMHNARTIGTLNAGDVIWVAQSTDATIQFAATAELAYIPASSSFTP